MEGDDDSEDDAWDVTAVEGGTNQEQQVETPIREPLPKYATAIPDRPAQTIRLVRIAPILVLGRMRRRQHLILVIFVVP